jgi:hypothetical protein
MTVAEWSWVVTAGCNAKERSRPNWMKSMVWTATTHAQRERDSLRFASDVTVAKRARSNRDLRHGPQLAGGRNGQRGRS